MVLARLLLLFVLIIRNLFRDPNEPCKVVRLDGDPWRRLAAKNAQPGKAVVANAFSDSRFLFIPNVCPCKKGQRAANQPFGRDPNRRAALSEHAS